MRRARNRNELFHQHLHSLPFFTETETTTVDSCYLEVQGTEILQDIRTSTFQICRIEEQIN